MLLAHDRPWYIFYKYSLMYNSRLSISIRHVACIRECRINPFNICAHMVRKSFTHIVLAIFLWVAALAAQDPAPVLNSELARLDRLLESARQALGVYENKEARDFLAKAEALRKE